MTQRLRHVPRCVSRAPRVLLPMLILVLAAGCGSGKTGGGVPAPDMRKAGMGDTPDAGTSPDLSQPPGPYTTPFPPTMPQVKTGSGAVLANPKVVPVFFPSDPLQSQVVSFLQAYLARSQAWLALAQYGVGAATLASPVILPQTLAASSTDTDLRTLLAARIADHSLPTPDANTAYVIFLPSAVSLSSEGGVSCQDFAGYHQLAQLADGTHVPYAVLPRCSRTILGELTSPTSHELAEMATDPVLTANNDMAEPYALWTIGLHGAEIGDLCQNLSDPALNESGIGVVARIWSNVAAQARQDPCQPALSGTSFFSVPILTELISVNINSVIHKVESVAVGAGQTQTIEVRLLAGGTPSPSWSVSAAEVPVPLQTGGQAPPVLKLSFMETPQGQDGTLLHLQITAGAAAKAGFTTVVLTSTGRTANGVETQTQWVAAVRLTN